MRPPPYEHPTRRQVAQALFALGTGLCLPRAQACEFFASTLRVLHPWTRASTPDARSAIVCMTIDQVSQDDRLIAAETPVAEGAEIGGPDARPSVDLAISAGQELVLSESGTFLRLVGLRHALEVGREYPLNLVFERGGVVSGRLSVDYARFR